MSVPAGCKWHWLAGLLLALWAGCGMAREAIDLHAYQSADGAIRLQMDGDLVDPYFAMKALLLADEMGLPVKPAAEAWIAWLLPRREAGGSFPRFVAQPGGGWKRLADADADDSTLALWISLLYRMHGDSAGMSPELQQSLRQARADLLQLRVQPAGIYHYARGADVGYLMDNAEVYEALRDDCRHGGKSCRLARQLERAVGKVFWDVRRRGWRTASHGEPAAAFYPRTAAQLFPQMAGMQMPRGQRTYDDWLAGEGLPWLLQDAEVLDYAWGLLTVAAIKNKRDDVARQWMVRAAPSRDGQRWNVLEEAVFQGLEQRFGPLAK
jgi:hypothetical protein